MATKPLTALQRRERKKIKALIREGRIAAMVLRKVSCDIVAQTLDGLADIAEKYLKESDANTNRMDR